MGLFDFVKDAGENLLKRVGLDGDPDPADVVAKIHEHRLPVEDLSVSVKGDKAAIAGRVPDQETREKVVLVVGNVKGIAQVNDQLSVESAAPPLQAPGIDSPAEDEPVADAARNLPPSEQSAQLDGPPAAVFYTVERGDTLSKIAKSQYGNAMKYPVIFEANKPMLSDPDKIYPGQVLRIPPLDLV